MHWQALQFFAVVRSLVPQFFDGVRVLEIGSRDVNGSIRNLFTPAAYVGVDLAAGPGVDVVCSGDAYRSPHPFDTAASAECFEHNPRYLETLENMIAHTRPGGLVVFTCASEGRPEHGTARTGPCASPGTAAVGWDHYKNLGVQDFAAIDPERTFAEAVFHDNRESCDLYFAGIKRDPDRDLGTPLSGLRVQTEQIEAAGWDLRRAGAEARSGDAAAAVRTLLSVRLEPRNPRFLRRIARMVVRHDLVGALLDAEDDAAAAPSDRTHVYETVASILTHKGRLDEAEAVSRRALGAPSHGAPRP